MARLKEKYQKEIVPALMEKFSYRNRLQVPRKTPRADFSKKMEKKPSDSRKSIETLPIQRIASMKSYSSPCRSVMVISRR